MPGEPGRKNDGVIGEGRDDPWRAEMMLGG